MTEQMLDKNEKYLNVTFVKEAIKKVYSYLNSQIVTIQINEKKYSGFLLDISKTKQVNRIGIGSVSVGLSMYTYEEYNDDTKMQEMCSFIIDKQLSNGGWTISALREMNIALTYTTCYALNALILFDSKKNNEQIEKGLNWLFSNNNSSEGWGYKERDISSIYATAEVLKLIQVAKNKNFQINPNYEEIIKKAKRWLFNQKENEHWKYNNKPSLYYTALCYKVLINDNDFSIELGNTQKWLLNNLSNANCLERIQYKIDCNGNYTYRDQIDCFTHSTIINSLLSNKNLVFNKAIEEEISFLLTKKQDNLGFFSCNDEDIKVPIFLNHNIVDTLDLYISYLLRRNKPTLLKSIIELYNQFPSALITFSIMALLGLFTLLYNLKNLITSIPDIITTVIKFFEKQSGVANFVTISGVSFAVIIIAVFNSIKKKNKQNEKNCC